MRIALILALVLTPAWLILRDRPEAAEGEALYVVSHVDVIPPFTEQGRALLHQFEADTLHDPGAVRFEVMEQIGRPNHSMVVEVWKDRASFDAHAAAEHTKAFRAKLHPMLGSPIDERLHTLAP